MATVSKRNNSYRIKVSNGYDSSGKQIVVSKTWTPAPGMSEKQITKELERQKVLFEQEVKQGRCAEKRIKFEPLSKEWFAQIEKEGKLKPGTIKRFHQLEERTYAAIGHLYMDAISTRALQKFINGLADEGLSTKTQKLHLNFVSDVFKYAIKNGLATENPAHNVTAIKKEAQERVVFTPDQTRTFLRALNNVPIKYIKYKTFFTLAIYGGFRRGELLGLEWKDVDFQNSIITINRISYYSKGAMQTGTPKTKKSMRSLKLPAVVFDLLNEYKAEQLKDRFKLGDAWINSDRLFTQWNGEPMGPDTARHWLEKFCAENGLPRVCVHSFRHLNASLLIEAGTDVKTVSAALGHSQTSTTLDIYARSFLEAQAKASEAIAEVLTSKLA